MRQMTIEYWYIENDDYDFTIETIEAKNLLEVQEYCIAKRGHYVKLKNIQILSSKAI